MRVAADLRQPLLRLISSDAGRVLSDFNWFVVRSERSFFLTLLGVLFAVFLVLVRNLVWRVACAHLGWYDSDTETTAGGLDLRWSLHSCLLGLLHLHWVTLLAQRGSCALLILVSVGNLGCFGRFILSSHSQEHD